MTVFELIAHLTNIAESGYGGCEVMLATQPTCPLASSLADVKAPDSVYNPEEDESSDNPGLYVNSIQEGDHEPDEAHCDVEVRYEPPEIMSDDLKVVWLTGGAQRRPNPYAPRCLWE